jgi:hypothetical protein
MSPEKHRSRILPGAAFATGIQKTWETRSDVIVRACRGDER